MKDEKLNDKDFSTLIYESQKQQEIIQDADKLLESWQTLTLEEKTTKRDSLLHGLALLEPKDAKLCVSKLSEGGIITEKEAREVIGRTRLDLGIDDDSQKNKPAYTAYFSGLVDIVEADGSAVFLVKENDNLVTFKQIKKDNQLYLPPLKTQIPWLLPSAKKVLEIFEQEKALDDNQADSILYDDLLAYHKSISELPHEAYYDLITAWDFHTYLLDSSKYSPMICLFAVPERGKTRTGQGMIYIAYRGIHVKSLRDAYLVRVANDLKATLFFDVRDIWHKAEKNGTEDILLHRFERGAKVPRVLYPERGPHRDMVYYSIFGATVISINEGAQPILETRAIQINMPQTKRTFENDITPEFALSLKERLLSFRARHLNHSFTDIRKPALGRLGDILKPLQQIIRLVKPEREPLFLQLIKELEETRLIEKTDSLEAQILRQIIGLKEVINKGTLPVKDITDSLNADRPDKYQLSYQRIGRRLLAMGFKKAWTATGTAAIILDEEAIEQLKVTYGLKETPVIPVTAVTPVS